MTGLFWNLLLALIWLALTGVFSGLNLGFGFGLGYLILALLHHQIPALRGYPLYLPRLLAFGGFFVRELVRANLKVALDVLTPLWRMTPAVLAYELEASTPFEIMLVANFISLTPGTLSLDLSDDRRVLYIHAMFAEDEASLRQDLRRMESRLLAVLRAGQPAQISPESEPPRC